MRLIFLSMVALFVVAGPVSLSRAATDDVDPCTHGVGDEAIAACTRVIDSGGSGLASAYFFRGLAYYGKGGLDHAIADYNEAIWLDPKYVVAYVERGNAYDDKGDFDRAIADYTEAIRFDPLPRLSPSVYMGGYDHLNVYNNRGFMYIAMGDFDRAIADYNEAIRLDPKYALAYSGRGFGYDLNGDHDRATADYNEAIRLDPKYAEAYTFRGLGYLYNNDLPKALADVSHASELAANDAYNALWVDIIGQRSDVPSRLSEAISKIDMTAWPAPVIRMFLGQITPAAVFAAANDPDAWTQKDQVCEANFYSGELALRQGAKDDATRLFALAASVCRRDYMEWLAANRELRALGATP